MPVVCRLKSAAIQISPLLFVCIWIAGDINQTIVYANVKRIAALGAEDSVNLQAADEKI